MKTSKREITVKALTTALFIFMIFSMTLLSSCVATVGTPHRHHSGSTIIISEDGHHDNGNHYGQKKNKH